MTIDVNIPGNEYKIILERGCLSAAGSYLNLDRRVLIVTDSGVPAEYADRLISLSREAVKVVIPEGEESKNLTNWEMLLSEMLSHSFSRKDCVVAVGGGVCGDLAGFAAASYMRGIDFYNIPTTVLSQVDSSIGGKTAVDFQGVKNIIGAFYQPKCVLIDPELLKTLPARQLSNGLAEALKMALNFNRELFRIFEEEDISENIDRIIAEAIKIKRDVVEQDEKESGLRRVLNFGHTLGHGIEVAADGSLYHGECVAVGMVPMCSAEVRNRLLPVLKKLSLPSSADFDPDIAFRALTHDKKASGNTVKAILCEEIGSFKVVDMSTEELKERLLSVCENVSEEV